MTLAYAYDGGAMTHDVEPSGISIPQRADMGEKSMGGIPLEDPSASLTMLGHRPFIVTESACTTQPRLFTGYVAERGIGRSLDRGMFVGPDARLHDLTIVDSNAIFGFRQITGVDGNRGAETWGVRLSWILGSAYLTGLISTNETWVIDSVLPMEAADYRKGYPSAVLGDLADRITKPTNWFAFWDATEVRLFFDYDTETIGDCTKRISNVVGDINSSTTFAPDSVATLAREPDQTYSGVTVEYANGSVYRHRASTAATYIARDTTISRPYTGSAATAQLQGELFLDAHAVEVDRITCSIQVPAVSVGLIRAGQRISVKFSHMPGYSAFTWMRIVACSPKPTNDKADFYDVALELVGPRPLPTVPLLGELVAHQSGLYGHEPPIYWPDGDEKVVFGGTGDTPPAGFPGWGNPHPISGPVEYIVHGAWAWLGFRMLANGIVDISSAGGFAGVSGGGASTTVTLRRNGAIIASQTQTDTHGSVHYWGGMFYFDETGIVASTGDEFGFGVSFAGWAGFEFYASLPSEGPDLTHFFISGVAGPGGTDTIGTLPPPPLTTHTTDPTVDDDSDAGYGVGDVWVNTATGEAFVNVDNTNGAAVWVSTTAGVTDHGALTGLADDDHTQYVLKRHGGKEVISTVAASGATETLSLADGNVHDVTLTADCTLTFAGATNGVACSFTLLLRQDGTGSWTTTWPGSVVWAGGSAPTLDETASTVAVLTFFTLDGGTTWYGFPTGGGGGTPGTGELLITDTPAGSPLVFADILQNEAGTALLYSDV